MYLIHSKSLNLASNDDRVKGYAKAYVDPNFERKLIKNIRPISNYYLAICLNFIFTSGIYDELIQNNQEVLISSLASKFNMALDRLTGLLYFLANEEVVIVMKDKVKLTLKGKEYGAFKAWYTLMIGSYSTTEQQIGNALYEERPLCDRDNSYVDISNCKIGYFDRMPIVRTLIERQNIIINELLYLGCDNASFLVNFCLLMPKLKAWGVESNLGRHNETCYIIRKSNMENRIKIFSSSTSILLRNIPKECNPDIVILELMLHKILSQEGESAVINLLRTIAEKFSKVNIIVIEIINEIDNPVIMQHGLAKNFWNPYYLLHYFTFQRLEKRKFWESIFDLAGLHIVDIISTDPNIDSSGLELGYLLRKKS